MKEQMPPRKFNFTKAAIEALPVTDKRVFYYDTGERGLAVLVAPSGRKTFYLYRKVKHTTTQLMLGAFPDMPVSLARDRAKVLNAGIVTGESADRLRRGRRGEATLGEVFAWFLDAHAKRHKRTWRQDERGFELYFKPLAGKTLSGITRQDVRRWYADIAADKGAPTANRALALLSSIYGRAISHDRWAGLNPCQRIEREPERARDRRLMPGEIEDFFAAVEREPNEDIRDYIHLALFTGQRKGNVVAMRWDEIDLAARVWRIPLTKNGQPLHVPLEGEELAILSRRKGNGSEWVFPGVGKTGHLADPQKGWNRIIKRANQARAERDEPPLRDLHIHDLRRTLGSYMVDTGASLHIVGKTLGHLSQATTARYARLMLDSVREAKRAAIQAMRAD